MRYYRKKISSKDIERLQSNISGVGVFGVFVIIFSSLFFMLGVSAYVVEDDITAFILGSIGILFGILLIIIGKQKVKADNEERILIEQERERIKKEQEEIVKQRELQRLEKLASTQIEKVDLMTGFEFEEFLMALYQKLGYNVELTKKSGDFGADLIIEKNNIKRLIQAKCYTTHKVSVSAIQEIAGSKNHYRIFDASVVTNNYFTEPAKKLALENSIQLIDRDSLVELMSKNGISTNNLVPEIKKKIIKNDDYSDINHDNKFSKELFVFGDKILDASNNFNVKKTRELLEDFYTIPLKTQQDYITYHFCIARIVLMIYRLRDVVPDFKNDILKLCDKDIEILPIIAGTLKNVTVPALTKKAILLTKENRFDEVIEVCDFATKYGFREENGSSFNLRKQKILIKMGVSNNEKP